MSGSLFPVNAHQTANCIAWGHGGARQFVIVTGWAHPVTDLKERKKE